MKKEYTFIAITSVVVFTLILWMMYLGSNPYDAQNRKQDILQSDRLNYLRGAITNYKTDYGKLPDNLGVLDVDETKIDKYTEQLYEYQLLDENTAEVCAQFKTDSRKEYPNSVEKDNFFVHAEGKNCFEFKVYNNPVQDGEVIKIYPEPLNPEIAR